MSLLDEAAPLAVDGDVAIDSAHLRGHVSLGARRRDGRARGLRRRGPARRAATRAGRRCCGPRPRTRRSPPGTWRRCSRTRAPRAPRCPRTTTALEACTARLALGMALVFSGAGDEGPRDAARGGRHARRTARCWTARRCSGAGRSRRRCSCARRARRASPSHARSRPRASAASPARSRRCSTSSRATQRRPIAGPRPVRSYYEAAELAHDTGQPGEECAALSGLAWLEAREGREESCRAHAGRCARAGAQVRPQASTRPGPWPRSATSSSRSGGRRRPSSD